MNTSKRLKLFLENFFAYGAIGILEKIIPVIMLPIMTRLIVDTADYGRYDMYSTLVGFGGSIAALGLYDAAFREYFEKDNPLYRRGVLTMALKIELISALSVAIMLAVCNRAFAQLFIKDVNSGAIVLMAAWSVLFGGANLILLAPTRLNNKRTFYVVSGVGSSIISYALAIWLVKRGYGYVSLVWSTLIVKILLTITYIIVNGKHFDVRIFDRSIAVELLKIGLPIAPVFLIYWVFNSMDKLMITNVLGLAQEGIYSIGAKVAMISQFIYMAFAGGWQYFAFSTMRDSDQVEMTSSILEYLGAISFAATFVVCMVDRWIFQILFTGDYVHGVIVFPYLFLSPLLLMLYQTVGNQFLVIKKSYYGLICLCVGCVVNLILNYFGIEWFGVKGAAMATLIGYAVSLTMGIIITYRHKLINVHRRFIWMCGIVAGFMAVQFFCSEQIGLCYALAGLVICVALYWKDARTLLRLLRAKTEPETNIK